MSDSVGVVSEVLWVFLCSHVSDMYIQCRVVAGFSGVVGSFSATWYRGVGLLST